MTPDENRFQQVFLSYATEDRDLADNLRKRLLAENIDLWHDIISMRGGDDWWQQITTTLEDERLRYMVLLMTAHTLEKEVVQKEWRYARQQGVCVLPVMATPDLDFEKLPPWMAKVHFYRYNEPEQWQNLLHDLRSPCEIPRVPNGT